MQVRIRLRSIGCHHFGNHQAEQADARHRNAGATGLQKGVWIVGVPFDGPLQDAPGRINPVDVRAQRRLILELPGKELGRHLQPAPQ